MVFIWQVKRLQRKCKAGRQRLGCAFFVFIVKGLNLVPEYNEYFFVAFVVYALFTPLKFGSTGDIIFSTATAALRFKLLNCNLHSRHALANISLLRLHLLP